MSPAHRLTAVIFARDGERCVYCEAFPTAAVRLSVDHVTPVASFERGIARGDPDATTNLVTACSWCNSLKRDMPLEVFALYLVKAHGWTRTEAREMMLRVKTATSRKVSK